ncbi:hypothetical protein KKR91_04370 [Arthrobacter jiangjiafuii]|uniref:Uncharacterized protein n=1 Tax=Arthrobacter jiangjiafuii TaxID=2817475 RepID=A0A975M6G6_9MICC|nr:hypothetical protein [Arthrobacter jiangjiafuii]MBP3043841.1 hypothetical protein [Arthrobacter jiangjiafuii]QWC10858.1 hypothetical protein KKR91_04370 [Arthrobacter jiangjiafuii]
MAGNLIARSVHDLSAAAWFGGSLMGAVGLNGAAAHAKDPTERIRLSSLGWKRWAPVQGTAIISHLVAGLAIVGDNKGRLAKQEGVGSLTVYKTAVTLAGAAVTLYAGVMGRRVEKFSHEGAAGATEPLQGASRQLETAQRRLKLLQWCIPVLSGAVIVMGAKHGEMQREGRVFKGLLGS